MDDCLIKEEVDYVEIIPVVRKYEWGKKEKAALTKVFYRNLKQVKELVSSKLTSPLNMENGDISNSIEFTFKEKTKATEGSLLVDHNKKRLIEVDNKNNEQKEEEEDFDEQEPYAELWYGSHVSSPSQVSFNGKVFEKVTLDDVISCSFAKQALISSSSSCNIGTNTTNQNKIPFLLKILSISKPLSLQVHPDKALAKELHSAFPCIYSDDNHKPEIAIALSEFETFCGFKDTLEILSLLESFPETLEIFGTSLEFISKTVNKYKRDKLPSIGTNSNDQNQEDPLFTIKKDLFINMLNSKPETINDALSKLVTRLERNQDLYSSSSSSVKKTNTSTAIALIEGLILRLHHHFPLDIGIISPLLLNYYKLNPGDAIFIGAGTIHSYISGECLECMANSDNVVRCGLTPKLKDVPTLIKAVNFQSNNSKLILNHKAFKSSSSLIDYFVDTVEEYHVQILSISFKNSNSFKFSTPTSSPYSLLLCLSGDCTVSFNESKPEDDNSNDFSSSLSHDYDNSPSKAFVILQGKAILVKCNTEISFHHLSPKDVKFAMVTLPVLPVPVASSS
ncbi:mannose-6-phosphate isomerase [Cryptosporidium sp. chipmunk genotype I]|uniref:mannose-6-phosphate isomerase n=1 Tax=Cryptosporidium sp. chipmunk genotype I TaxID=1280935 RepID=UPI00351A3946|nr:mannose-6-phosphate isomerase [Cryptosporidium sp. chipmunk genotype I]